MNAPESSVSPQPMRTATAEIVTPAGRFITYLPCRQHALFAGVYTTARDARRMDGGFGELIRVRLEQRENHHAGDRNVQPDGKCVARDTLVLREASAE